MCRKRGRRWKKREGRGGRGGRKGKRETEEKYILKGFPNSPFLILLLYCIFLTFILFYSAKDKVTVIVTHKDKLKKKNISLVEVKAKISQLWKGFSDNRIYFINSMSSVLICV